MGTTSAADISDLKDVIIERLAELSSLRIPGHLSRDENESITLEKRSRYLRNLLANDPGVFLERHGDDLQAEEIEYFAPLRSTSYEIDFYMKLLEDKATITNSKTMSAPMGTCPSSDGARNAATSKTAKNRRLAKLELLEQDGYFKMEAMRSREPYLYHLYIGQYGVQSPNLPLNLEEETSVGEVEEHTKKAPFEAAGDEEEITATVRSAAAKLAGSILDKQDELELMVRREAESESYALQEEEEESESDSDDEKDQRKEENETEPEVVPLEETNEEIFLDIVKQKFLSGQDTTINYQEIDTDSTLDDHFAALEQQNAEDAYFESSD